MPRSRITIVNDQRLCDRGHVVGDGPIVGIELFKRVKQALGSPDCPKGSRMHTW
jgi:hypothetical protein